MEPLEQARETDADTPEHLRKIHELQHRANQLVEKEPFGYENIHQQIKILAHEMTSHERRLTFLTDTTRHNTERMEGLSTNVHHLSLNDTNEQNRLAEIEKHIKHPIGITDRLIIPALIFNLALSAGNLTLSVTLAIGFAQHVFH